jgi:hypothetical protein
LGGQDLTGKLVFAKSVTLVNSVCPALGGGQDGNWELVFAKSVTCGNCFWEPDTSLKYSKLVINTEASSEVADISAPAVLPKNIVIELNNNTNTSLELFCNEIIINIYNRPAINTWQNLIFAVIR